MTTNLFLQTFFAAKAAPTKNIVAVLVVVLLSACTTHIPTQRSHYNDRVTQLSTLTQFALEGRIGLKQNGKGFASGVNWQNSEQQKRFELTGPLGGVHARLTEDKDGALLDIPDQGSVMSMDAESLLRDHFGWDIPINSLRFWVRGLATPPLQPLRFDEHGLPATIVEDGWQINYQGWQEINGLWLPSILEARRDNFVIKLSIHDWQF